MTTEVQNKIEKGLAMIKITFPRFLNSFINSLTGKYCHYCWREMIPQGFNDRMSCPNNCAMKEAMKDMKKGR